MSDVFDDDEQLARRRWMIGLAVAATLVLLVGAAWFARPAYRHFKEVRSLKQAREFLQKGDLRNGVLSLRAAIAANPRNLEATRRMADLLTEAQSPAAIGWWRRMVELAPTVENKVLLAASALRLEKPPFPTAAQSLGELKQAGAETNTAYHLVASQLALRLNRVEDAAVHLAAAAKLEPTNRLHQLNLATLRLRQPESEAAAQARQELTAMVSDPALGEHALRSLVADGLVRGRTEEARRFSEQLLALPHARFDDRLQQLNVLDAARSPQTNAWVAQLQAEAATNVLKTVPLVAWLASHGQARPALDWLAKFDAKIRTTMPLPLVESDCYITLKDWPGLEKLLADQNWEEQEPVRLALLARALREQNRRETADVQWRRALGSGKPEALAAVAQMAETWGWTAEAEEALWALVKRAPWQDWAWQALIRARTAAGDAAGLHRVYAALLESKPNAVVLKNNLAALGLLLKRDVEKCARLAREAHLAATNNVVFASTFAFALHVQGKTADGLRLLQRFPEAELQQPAVAIYYAVLLAASGQRDKAAPFVAIAEKGQLLPEEKVLLANARMAK